MIGAVGNNVWSNNNGYTVNHHASSKKSTDSTNESSFFRPEQSNKDTPSTILGQQETSAPFSASTNQEQKVTEPTRGEQAATNHIPLDEQTETDPTGDKENEIELTEDEQKEVEALERRDAEVRKHEQAHMAAAGQYARGGASFEFQVGPDGKRYAVGGEVQIDIGEGRTPEETIQKARIIRQAALAPAEPSAQDRRIAATASSMEQSARQEITEERMSEQSAEDEPKADSSSSASDEMPVSSTSDASPSLPDTSTTPSDAHTSQKTDDRSKTSDNGLDRPHESLLDRIKEHNQPILRPSTKDAEETYTSLAPKTDTKNTSPYPGGFAPLSIAI